MTMEHIKGKGEQNNNIEEKDWTNCNGVKLFNYKIAKTFSYCKK
jgi:hypothetical protein